MERTILTWNITNWITVMTMVILGSAVIGVGLALLKRSGLLPGQGSQA